MAPLPRDAFDGADEYVAHLAAYYTLAPALLWWPELRWQAEMALQRATCALRRMKVRLWVLRIRLRRCVFRGLSKLERRLHRMQVTESERLQAERARVFAFFHTADR